MVYTGGMLRMAMSTKIVLLLALFLLGFGVIMTPATSEAQTTDSFDVSAWVPYWRSKEGVASILPHLGLFTEVNPFMYTVRLDGSLKQMSPLTDEEWVTLRAKAKAMNVRFIPTVMWANADAMDTTFRNPKKRQEHIRAIASEVFQRGLDGIDIDYEAKHARTKPYFSLFLKELNEAIGFNKWIMCTIEARTPLSSRYSSSESIPDDIEYANDYAVINENCDRVRIMAYDQGRIDLALNKAKGDPYAPVADRDWVEKVVRLAKEDIDADKIVIGVPTYGYEYDMFTGPDGEEEQRYSRLWSFNPGYATTTAETLGLEPARNSAGELMLTFIASMSPEHGVPLPNATRVLSWSDAEAIAQKAKLSEELGVRGIAIFKVDGGQDARLWNVLSAYKERSTEVAQKEVDVALVGRAAQSAVALSMPTRDLERGARGEGARTLQKYLNGKGFIVSNAGPGSLGSETDYFGPATESALMRFQKEHSITPARGYYGPITRRTIRSL
jgi:spore germination protein YaaH